MVDNPILPPMFTTHIFSLSTRIALNFYAYLKNHKKQTALFSHLKIKRN
ncbi:hypothetical protein HMPREF0621_0484 [Pasteurella dagmatis ATCC 43325]|uniref:Uncharacterized protein n=1 Tax=Pasteurella dagmatis ATCC 43325 TaxID=667128 RepID=C9PNB0_9PAST|nr:hypothetical protein HMPREF0621_0484 [Pasteurella dagmatis ATCC 43325]